MRAAVIDRPGSVTVRDVPRPARGLALVRVAQAGICGTDLKIAAGDIPVAARRVLGHEMTGWVESPGPREAVAAGTSVLVYRLSGSCDLCRRDLPQLCRAGALLGRDVHGCFAEFVAVDEACLHPIPASVPTAEAALLQVISTCVHAQDRLRATPGGTAVVVGLGASPAAHPATAGPGVGTIIGMFRMEKGPRAPVRCEPRRGSGRRAAGGGRRDRRPWRGHRDRERGHQQTLAQAMRLAGAGGTVLVFGITVPAADRMPTYEWYVKELTILNPRAARPRATATWPSGSARSIGWTWLPW